MTIETPQGDTIIAFAWTAQELRCDITLPA
jgi:hypothetical protein